MKISSVRREGTGAKHARDKLVDAEGVRTRRGGGAVELVGTKKGVGFLLVDELLLFRVGFVIRGPLGGNDMVVDEQGASWLIDPFSPSTVTLIWDFHPIVTPSSTMGDRAMLSPFGLNESRLILVGRSTVFQVSLESSSSSER